VSVAVWLGSAPPVRSVRWLDGALATAARLGPATALVTGKSPWLDLAADRAMRAGVACIAAPTDLELDYIGWAQIASALVRKIQAKTILVDEASRPERFPEVAAIADLLDVAQLTHVVQLVADGAVLHATRSTGRELSRVRVRGDCVIGVRIAGPVVEEHPTPLPSSGLRRLELPALGLDPLVLGHRALPPRGTPQPRKGVERIAEYLAVHVAPRGDR
jgi:hypothetical protein